MTKIHHVAAEGFALGAASYVAGRPDYPPEIEDWLRRDLGLGPGKTALDLAAGPTRVRRVAGRAAIWGILLEPAASQRRLPSPSRGANHESNAVATAPALAGPGNPHLTDPPRGRGRFVLGQGRLPIPSGHRATRERQLDLIR